MSTTAEPEPEAVPPLVDLTQPILRQVGTLGDAYDAWVHGALSPKATRSARSENDTPARWSGSVRIFERDWLEGMTHVPWWIVPVVWIPIVSALFAVGVDYFGHSAVGSLALGALGLFVFTFVEYVLHRFVFHFKPRSPFGRQLHFLLHGVHHFDPWDGTRLVLPPLLAVLLAAATFGVVVLAAGLSLAVPLMGGILVGYMIYDLTHYYTHHAKPTTRVGRYLKAYHLAHHHKYWQAMYGVSNPLWDIVFRTGEPRR